MELYQISDVQRDEIYKSNGVNQEMIDKDVKLIEEWIEKQAHLPKKFQYEFFPTRMLITNKFSVERAKERIEKYFTLKSRNQNFFTVFDTDDFVKPSKNTVIIAPLPKLGPRNERIVFLAISHQDAELYTIHHYLQMAIAVFEMTNMYDRTASMRVILDGKNYTFEHLKKLDISGFLKMGELAIKGYGLPMVSVDVMNLQPGVSLIITLTKKLLSGKLLERFKIHNSLESLQESIPREYLPDEYGGSAGKLSDVAEKIKIEVENHRKMLAESANYASNESLRVGGTPGMDVGENFGLDGTFKKLDLD